MFVEDIKIGMRVFPIQRTLKETVKEPKHSAVWRKAISLGQPYLIVTQIDPVEGKVLCNVDDTLGGDYFMDFDLEPFT